MDLRLEAQVHSGGSFTIARMAGCDGDGQEVSQQSSDGAVLNAPDCFGIYIPVHGRIRILSGEQDILEPGSCMLFAARLPSYRCVQAPVAAVCFLLPRSFALRRQPGMIALCDRRLDATRGALRVATEAILALERDAESMSEANFHNVARCVAELLLCALYDENRGRAALGPARSSKLVQAKQIIHSRCADPELSLRDIANECGLSMRSMHELFHSEGRTFRGFLMQERLQKAWDLIQSAPAGSVSVMDVYLASGFRNLSHFSTAFRRAFAVSPREALRAAVMRQAERAR